MGLDPPGIVPLVGNDQFYCGVRKAFPTLLEGSKPDLLTARIRSEPVEQTDSSAKSKHPLTRTTTSHRHLKVTTASVRSKFSMTSEKGASRLREVDAGNDNTSWSTARVYRTDEDDQAGQHPSIMPTRPVFASIDYKTKNSSSTATKKAQEDEDAQYSPYGTKHKSPSDKKRTPLRPRQNQRRSFKSPTVLNIWDPKDRDYTPTSSKLRTPRSRRAVGKAIASSPATARAEASGTFSQPGSPSSALSPSKPATSAVTVAPEVRSQPSIHPQRLIPPWENPRDRDFEGFDDPRSNGLFLLAKVLPWSP